MSVICQNFVQNAWKKELCSNCFKSKDEHNLALIKKPLPISSDKVIESIIKHTKANKKNKRAVSFKNEISKVIGYGGEEWSDAEEDNTKNDEEDNSAEEDSDSEAGNDDERELRRLTKANTDFNTVNANLLVENGEKKSYTHLKLGTPLIDADGRKQTLLVSVTPFGQETSNILKKFSKTVSHIPVAKNNKETVTESKNSAVLTSYITKTEDNVFKEEKSLLEEISETLEKSKTPIQIITKKKTQKDTSSTVGKTENADKNKENEKETVFKTTSTYLLEKAAEKSTEKIKDLKQNKSSIPERKNGITRAAVIKKDQEKPAIYQTSTAKIELLNNKNLKMSSQENSNTTNKLPQTENVNKSEKTDDSKIVDKIEVVEENNDKKLSGTDTSKNESIDTNKTEASNKCNSVQEKESSENDDSSNETANSLTESVNGEQENLPSREAHSSLPSESREQAGEPDGHADPDGTNEPPALPTTPPPVLETRSSFLHGNNNAINDKPKLPTKPATVLIRKPILPTNQHSEALTQQSLTTFSVSEARAPIDDQKPKLDKQDSNNSDNGRGTTSKRRAPKPPALEDSPLLYSRNSIANPNTEPPVIREKEKRERASSCSPKLRNEVCNNPNGTIRNCSLPPEPAPRKSISLSTDSLTGVGMEEKKKEKSKGRFSLKKFLRMSSSKDLQKAQGESPKYEEVRFVEPQPRPRLVIVHPLELDGAKVEVVSKPLISQEHSNYSLNDYHVPIKTITNDHSIYDQQRSSKPPPPPRNLEDWHIKNKPNLPHPPKSAEIISKQRHFDKGSNMKKKNDGVYANIGEVRSSITPNKPQRTASMREREAALIAAQQRNHNTENYEPIEILNKRTNKENVYDYINGARSSSSDYEDSNGDKNSPTNKKNVKMQRCLRQARSSSNVDVSGDYFKYHNIPRSASLTYCGSETESEIYSPYSFYGSESEVAEDDRDWTHNGRTYKLRSRKGRSIVHKNLEDNYGAVVVANHEALVQVLENIQQGVPIQPALRGLKTSQNLQWSDFSVKENLPSLAVGPRIFHQAVWGAHHVTLVISTGTTPATSSISLGTFGLMPITEFTDLVPSKYLPTYIKKEDDKLIQASIAILPWMQVNTIQTYTELLKNKSSNSSQEELYKDACFILLQLVNALKMLQAQGIEELPLSLTSFVICREMEKDCHHRLCVLQGLGEEIALKKENIKFGSLCLCATTVLTHLLPNAKLTPFLRSLLNTERAVSLTQVKSILEFALWGPSDVSLSTNIKERELALQRWLDLQRATVLHGLVCARIQLTIYEECHLLFLVRSNAKMMCDASLLLDSNNKQMLVSAGHK